jgi:hypothetical protein
VPVVVPEQPAKLPPSETVTEPEGTVKPEGKVMVTVSPIVSRPDPLAVKFAVQFVLAVLATVLVLVKLTEVTEPPGAVIVSELPAEAATEALSCEVVSE